MEDEVQVSNFIALYQFLWFQQTNKVLKPVFIFQKQMVKDESPETERSSDS